MNSIKSAFTVLFLLVVSYGVYRLIHTPDPMLSGEGAIFVSMDSKETEGDSRKTSSWIDSISGAIHNWTGSSQPGEKDPGATVGDKSTSTIPTWPAESNNPAVLVSANQGTGESPNASATERIPSNPTPNMELNSGAALAAPALSANGEGDSAIMTGPLTPVSDSGEINSAPTSNTANLSSAWPQVDGYLRKGEIANALKLLSGFYRSDLPVEDRAELLRWLDALAFKVIYSTEHQLVTTPHVVQSGETIESIAQSWNVPALLVLNVNRGKIPSDRKLIPGLELKVIQGPFRAEIDQQRQELTLFLGDYYAGRFSVDTSACTLPSGQPLRVQSLSESPQGEASLVLSSGIVLGAARLSEATNAIVMSPNDAQDLCSILAANSQISVIR